MLENPTARSSWARRLNDGPWLIIALGLVIRLTLAWSAVQSQDAWTYRVTAEILQAGGHLYADTGPEIYSYPPMWAGVSVAAYWLEQHTTIPFLVWIQVPIILADAAIAYVIYLLVGSRRGAAKHAAALYALNPLPIILCTWQQQIDAIVILFVMLAVYYYIRGNTAWSALSLAVGIGLKGYPILLLPVFLIHIPSWKRRLYFVVLAIFPVLASFAPFLLEDSSNVVRDVLSYSGYAGFGWGMLWYQLVGLLERRGLLADALPPLISIGKFAFLAAYCVALYVWYRYRKTAMDESLILQISLLFGGFCAIYGAISAQYLLWILPFLIIINQQYAAVYSIASIMAILGFYWANCCIVQMPEILQRSWQRLLGADILSMPIAVPYFLWIVSNGLWYMVVSAWLIAQVTRGNIQIPPLRWHLETGYPVMRK